MKTALLAAAVLAAAPALADDSSRPYVFVNGRPTAASPSAPRAPAGAAAQTSSFGAKSSAPGVIAIDGAAPPTRAAAPLRARSRGFSRRSRGVTATGASGGSGDQAPPNFSKPGALIRTAGQLPQYSPTNDQRTLSIEGGGFVAIDPRKAHDVGRAPGITYAPPDKLPPPNPTGGAGGNAVTANPGAGTTIINNNHSGNTNGNQGGGSGNGNGNGNGNSNGAQDSATGFDPAF